MSVFLVNNLPGIDQSEIKRGKCPWCVVPLVPGGITSPDAGDVCPECGDEFIGKLTIED